MAPRLHCWIGGRGRVQGWRVWVCLSRPGGGVRVIELNIRRWGGEEEGESDGLGSGEHVVEKGGDAGEESVVAPCVGVAGRQRDLVSSQAGVGRRWGRASHGVIWL